jgi:hypothetical protein
VNLAIVPALSTRGPRNPAGALGSIDIFRSNSIKRRGVAIETFDGISNRGLSKKCLDFQLQVPSGSHAIWLSIGSQ